MSDPRSRSLITPSLLHAILDQYELRRDGLHGVTHWARVLENGRRLRKSTGARAPVVELFAVFHDACRVSEGDDPAHGARGADLAERLRGTHFDLSDPDFELLQVACVGHTDGGTAGDVTVQTCWDADRLDLGRVGITPRRRFLCTEEARKHETLDWANGRGRARAIPPLLGREWRLDRTGRFLESEDS